jgi:hypothetical protein
VRWRGTRWTDSGEFETIGSSDGVFFSGREPTALWLPWAIYTPSTHPFEIVGFCGSAEECETHTTSYPSHSSAKLLVHRLAHVLCVLSVRLSLELSECKVCLPCEVILEWIKLYKVRRQSWSLSGSPACYSCTGVCYARCYTSGSALGRGPPTGWARGWIPWLPKIPRLVRNLPSPPHRARSTAHRSPPHSALPLSTSPKLGAGANGHIIGDDERWRGWRRGRWRREWTRWGTMGKRKR